MVKVTKAKLLKAFNKSIRKWENIHSRMKHSDEYPCGLCELFMDHRSLRMKCTGCPLHQKGDGPAVCFYEWHVAHNAVAELLKSLKRERAKVVDC